MKDLSPFVYWAQTETQVTLRIDLKNTKSPDVRLTEDELEFTGVGVGAKGTNKYHFHLDFHQSVDPKKSHYRVMDREIEFSISKKLSQWWPRLIADEAKPAWLKLDFDKWKSEDDDEDDGEPKDFSQQIKDIYSPRAEEKMQEEAYRTIYMFMYNMFMFSGFAVLVIMLLVYAAKDRQEGINNAYSNVGALFAFFQLFQLFEIIFTFIGWTGSQSVAFPLLQITGRLVHFLVMIVAEPRMQTEPVVYYLFLVWCLAEIGRYPYYMLKIFDIEVKTITWIRYSLWIVLYPLGFLCEGMVIFKNISYYEESKRFSYHLPNMLNWSFDLPSIMRVYLLLFFFPLMYVLMSNMHRQRRQKLGPKRTKGKKKSE